MSWNINFTQYIDPSSLSITAKINNQYYEEKQIKGEGNNYIVKSIQKLLASQFLQHQQMCIVLKLNMHHPTVLDMKVSPKGKTGYLQCASATHSAWKQERVMHIGHLGKSTVSLFDG